LKEARVVPILEKFVPNFFLKSRIRDKSQNEILDLSGLSPRPVKKFAEVAPHLKGLKRLFNSFFEI
jgi:hypothetical protein